MKFAGIILRKTLHLASFVIQNFSKALRNFQRLLDTLRHATSNFGRHHQTIDHNFDVVLDVFLEKRKFVQCINHAINTRASKTLARKFIWNVGKFTLFRLGDRRKQNQPRAFLEIHHAIDNILWSSTRDISATNRTMRRADSRKKKAEIIINFRHRGDR